jgi:hypothetical protein
MDKYPIWNDDAFTPNRDVIKADRTRAAGDVKQGNQAIGELHRIHDHRRRPRSAFETGRA